MKKLRLLTLLVAATFVFGAVAAHADTLTWTLSGVTFDDGGTANGSFTYDSDTDSFLSFNINTTAGSNFGAFNYSNGNATAGVLCCSDNDFFFNDYPANDRYLRLTAVSGLTSPGTIALGGGPYGEGYECNNCGNVRYITAGELTSVTETPEPGSLALLGSGLVGLAGGIRRKLKA